MPGPGRAARARWSASWRASSGRVASATPAAVEAALRGLREAASRPGASETNLMPHFIRCAAAYATLGEQCAVLRGVFGEYREPVAV